MSNTVNIKNFSFNNIQKTMFLPLWGRYLESQKKNPLLVDSRAIDIINSLNYDFSSFSNNLKEYNALAWVIRAKTVDTAVKNFISRYPNGTIVNIGAGLDTTFDRVDNGTITWFDLDLPESISFRKKLIPETEKSKCLSKSVFDYSWFKDLGDSSNVLLIAAGVLMFFNENQLKELFLNLSEAFPNGEIFFDTLSREGLQYSNEMMKKAGLQENLLSWGINTPEEMIEWNDNMILLDSFPYYKYISRNPEWTSEIIDAMNLCDENRAANFYHIKFK